MSTTHRSARAPGPSPCQAVLLGTAQDGGVPQAGCGCIHCTGARQDPRQRRRVVCLGLVDRENGHLWLVDATPDFREQLHHLEALAPGARLAGILLTHAHMGHYTGLVHLGKEAWNARDLPLYASKEMLSFLAQHAPWCQLLAEGNVAPVPVVPGQAVHLGPALSATPLAVPHRNEWSDTLAYRIQGPRRTLLYCPDIDGWDRWEQDLGTLLDQVDVALLDGCFFRADEVPGRDIREIPHPLVTETLARSQGRRAQVVLVHLNHTNPLLHPGPEREWVHRAGALVGQEGQGWEL